MSSKTILIWGQAGLLGSSVEHFLSSQQRWQVVALPAEEPAALIVGVVEDLDPDIVILQQGPSGGDSRLPGLLIESRPGLKVITLNLVDNQMEVYSKQDILIRTAEDLIAAIDA